LTSLRRLGGKPVFIARGKGVGGTVLQLDHVSERKRNNPRTKAIWISSSHFSTFCRFAEPYFFEFSYDEALPPNVPEEMKK